MYLIDLIRSAGLDQSFALSDQFHRLDIKGIEIDSRKIESGFLFAALPGQKTDGLDFIDQAIDAGAVAVLVPTGSERPKDTGSVAVLESENVRKDTAHLVSAFYSDQPSTIVAVTGTNGKTSIVNFVRQIWQELEYKSASLGTIGLQIGDHLLAGTLTTPDTVSLHKTVSDAAKNGVTHLAVEASSHGLDQYRLDGLKLQAAGFTNLTHEHLDYHGTLENYRIAKSRLFDEVLPEGDLAVLNADSTEYETFKEISENRGHEIVSYGYKGADLKIIERFPQPKGQDVRLSLFGMEVDLSIPLVGEFQLMNVLCATGLAMAGIENGRERIEDIWGVLSKIQPVRGRLELVSGHPQGAAIYVDYAHTPDALETVLNACKPHVNNRLVCVVGCGGDRDKTKRSIMGKIATELADIVIVTDDNPRREDPATIRKEILKEAPDALEIAPRGKAIREAVKMLETGDVLLIAGKGHEQGQIIETETHHFDDVEEAQKAIGELS